jgi:hypothetical protein
MEEIKGLKAYDPGDQGYFHKTYKDLFRFSPALARGLMSDLKKRILDSPSGGITLEKALDQYSVENPGMQCFVFDQGIVYAVRPGDEYANHQNILAKAEKLNRLIFSHRNISIEPELVMRSSSRK